MTFEQFMLRVDKVITASTPTGLGVHDFADACWWDLYDDLGDDCTDEDIVECLCDADDLYANFMQINDA